MAARSETTLPGGPLDRLQRAWNGYSDHGRITAQRIVEGDITPEDRTQYKKDEYARLGTMLSSLTPPHASSGIGNIIQNVGAYKKAVQQIENLPDGVIDMRLRNQELIKMEQWGLACRIPRQI